MPKFKSVFWDDLNKDLQDPRLAAMFYLEQERLRMVSSLLNEIDQLREAAEINKAELARLLNTEPANVRRLFSAKKANPTAANLAELALAIGCEIKLVPLSESKKKKVAKAFATQSF